MSMAKAKLWYGSTPTSSQLGCATRRRKTVGQNRVPLAELPEEAHGEAEAELEAWSSMSMNISVAG